MSRPPKHPLVTGHPPSWAWGWGKDRYGVFTEIRVGEVVQTMRWIPPGSFAMGSPENEVGRWKDEGPQHRVELTEGFWLADTPCTQALWTEVMGENPSRFQSPTRPVEQVSWEDCQRFCKRLEERLPGFAPRLPTEAEWEYACRAGTLTATWLGDLEILGERNAPLLDEISWYGGNSGVEFDLDDGESSSGWKEKQYPHKKAGTREVKTRKPNPWGLYDPLGNVWEWCEDAWDGSSSYEGGDRVDPVGAGGSDRGLRGGSWDSNAQLVRAAYRYWFDPGYRRSDAGFRLSSGPGLRS